MTAVPVKIDTMRQSTIGTADACLHRLHYLFNPEIPKKGSILRSIGTGYHAGIAEYYLRRRMGGPIDPSPTDRAEFLDVAVAAMDEDIAENEFFDWRYQPRTYRQEEILINHEDACNMIERALDTYFEGEHYWPENYGVAGIEMHFEFDYPGLPGWTMSGTMDLAVVDLDTGLMVVDDQKLTRKQWNKKKTEPTNAQAAWYTYAASLHFGRPVEEVGFTFSVLGLEKGFQRWTASRNRREVEATLERGRVIAQLIDQGGPYPPNPSSFLCSEAYCDFWMHCPFGAALNGQ